jgi:hypothetical protein
MTAVPATKSPVKGAKASTRALLHADQHLCSYECACQASVVLAMQCLFEMHRYSVVDDLLMTYYSAFADLPYHVFIAWVQLKLHRKEYASTATAIVQYLEQEKDITLRTEQRLNTEQYESIIELLVFHCLVNLKSEKDAADFLKNNMRLREWKRDGYLYYLEQIQQGDLELFQTPLPPAPPSEPVSAPPVNTASSSSLPSVGASSSAPSGPTANSARPAPAASAPAASIPAASSPVPVPLVTSTTATAAQAFPSERMLAFMRLFGVAAALYTAQKLLARLAQIPLFAPLVALMRAELSKFGQLALSSGFGRIFS